LILKLEKDLNLTDNQYAVALSVFFISYALFEAPSNILLKRLKPHIWIPIIMSAWGLVMTLMAFVANFNGLTMARFVLGVTEAGLYLTHHLTFLI
jgi:sugar phosphate permease